MSWLRLEGAARDPDLTEGLSARIADPLWKLARQWQVGEFHGEDAASPILVTAEMAITPLTAFASDATAAMDRPLEVMVEQEPADDDLRLSLELGWLLLRSLTAAGLPANSLRLLRAGNRLSLPPDDRLDPAGRVQLELLARRSLDGIGLAGQLRQSPGATKVLLDRIGVPANMRTAIAGLVREWQQAVDGFVRLPAAASSWKPASLEYQFRVAAGDITLDASEYRGGALDWYHFRRAKDAKPLDVSGQTSTRPINVLPTPVQFHGMPDARFWSIEDRTVSFGDLAAGPEDLVRAIVGGFAAVYGDDWLVVPCNVPFGSLVRVTKLTVHDDYGRHHDIPAAATLDGPDRVWRFFEIEGDDGRLLLVAPALPDVEEGPPLERVDFKRDQVSNLAWAIERRAIAASGRSVDRDAAAAPLESDPSNDQWVYQAYTPVPQHWIPLVPVRLGEGDSEQVYLRRGRMAVAPLLPMGKLLDAAKPLRINEEAIAEAGLRVERRYQRARDAAGTVHLWIGRRVRTGSWPAAGRFTPDRLNHISQSQRQKSSRLAAGGGGSG
jgi:hypothetical protein